MSEVKTNYQIPGTWYQVYYKYMNTQYAYSYEAGWGLFLSEMKTQNMFVCFFSEVLLDSVPPAPPLSGTRKRKTKNKLECRFSFRVPLV